MYDETVLILSCKMKDRATRPTIQMVHYYEEEEQEQEPLVDLTESLPVRSKKTERLKKRTQHKKVKPTTKNGPGILDLPYELLLSILAYLKPSEVVAVLPVNQALFHLIRAEEGALARKIIDFRYPSIAKCFRLPARTRDVDPSKREALLSNLPRKAFHHIQIPDPNLICTCMSCVNRWNCLSAAVDFHYWQDHLEKGTPIRPIPRGTHPEWNVQLVFRSAGLVIQALESPLIYASILELHLNSTIRSIRRHGENKFNQRRRFLMTDEDARSGTDAFLERNGPQTVDVPYHRDNYYLLEAFMPNRCWIKELDRWVYMAAEQHDKDVDIAVAFAAWKKRKADEETREAERKREEELRQAETDQANQAVSGLAEGI